jgi:hypothetical protein
MNRVEEIERAIESLTPEEFAQVARRVHDLEQKRWDAQLDGDAAAGRLEFLSSEARDEQRNGLLTDWPPSS